jgi:hypothetical protein
MRRKTTVIQYGHGVINIANQVKPEMLSAFGHVMLVWNLIETELDAALPMALQLPLGLWVGVRSRLSGLEAKTDLMKEALHLYRLAPDDLQLLIDTVGDFSTLKIHRDSLAHVRLIDPEAPFAPTVEKRGHTYEVAFSIEVLNLVIEHFDLFRIEMLCVYNVISYRWAVDHFGTGGGPGSAEILESFERSIPQNLSMLRDYRTRRQSLQQLPKFHAEAPKAVAS